MLLWHEFAATPDDVSSWCRETARGCWLDSAIEGLLAAGFEIDELNRCALEEIRNLVQDPDEPEPVIATLKDPFVSTFEDHAVVVTAVGLRPAEAGEREVVEYMDPLIGRVVELSANRFQLYWDTAGGRAFVIRP